MTLAGTKRREPMRILLLGASVLLLFRPVYSQTAQWSSLPNAPVPSSRINDVFFVNPGIGWIVSGAGLIYRTTNGGVSWVQQLNKTSTTHFRSVGFIDSLRGWAGCLGIGDVTHPEVTDTTILYHTTNAGITWLPVNAVSGAIPRGLCGMQVVNDSVICAVGRVRGPAYFYRSTDAGTTWMVKDMGAYAAGLVDVRFFGPDTGFAVGLTDANNDSSSGIVLATTDGGQSWTQRFKTTRKGEWCWKLSFPSRNVGYASLQRDALSPIYFLKTTDAGTTWSERLFISSYYFVQGIGFENDSLGWIGGSGTLPPYATTDGGDTWHTVTIGQRLNRFRFFGDTLGYAVGVSVYKYTRSNANGVFRVRPNEPREFSLGQNYPNPFNPTTVIRFRLASGSHITLAVYDELGRLVETLVEDWKPAGNYEIVWHAFAKPSGVYFCRFQTFDEMNRSFSVTRKMLLLK